MDVFKLAEGAGSRPGGSKAEKLRVAFDHFRAFCAGRCFYPRDMQDFTPELFGWEIARDFPEVGCKAEDCKMLFQWMIDFFSSVPLEFTEPITLAYKGCCGFDNFCRAVYRSGDRIWWTREEARHAHDNLRTFLVSYRRLAAFWHGQNHCLFNMTPKYHFAMHWLHDLRLFLTTSNAAHFLNPGVFSTPLMEDFVGITSRIARVSHPSSVPLSVIRKYLVEARRFWTSRKG